MRRPSGGRERHLPKIVLDMDTGVDDAVAIALAVSSPELEVLAITNVAGNAGVNLCSRNSLLMRELLGASFPVASGAATPLSRELLTAPEVHGEDGLGGAPGSLPEPLGTISTEPAHELLLRIGREHPREVTLVTTGPLTNLGLALKEDPRGLSRYARIVSMGGAFDVPGNTGMSPEGPVAEFNMYVDPEAAAMVLGAGFDVTLVPLDATEEAVLRRASLEGRTGTSSPAPCRPGRSLSGVLYRALDYYMRYQKSESGLDAGFMHDPLAVASVVRPELLSTRRASVTVLCEERERGRTILEDAAAVGRGVSIALTCDPVMFGELLENRVLGPVFGTKRST
jgi:purine nucleosidase